MKKIILASNSPRRRELLGRLGYTYEVRVLDGIDESYPETLKGCEVAAYISRVKADAYRATITDEPEAMAMLRSLSGRTHLVYTGVTIVAAEKSSTFVSRSDVTFAMLSEEEILHYVVNYRPMDKAGAYGIQEWIGYVGVERIEGSYFNVMGLPVQRLYVDFLQLCIVMSLDNNSCR